MKFATLLLFVSACGPWVRPFETRAVWPWVGAQVEVVKGRHDRVVAEDWHGRRAEYRRDAFRWPFTGHDTQGNVGDQRGRLQLVTDSVIVVSEWFAPWSANAWCWIPEDNLLIAERGC